MTSSAPQHAASSALAVEVLNGLLEAEQNGLFRFLETASPYLNHAAGALRRPLHEMVQACTRHAARLYELIEALGGVPASVAIGRDEEYLSYLSLKFLLPQLIQAKQQMIDGYERALGIRSLPAEVASWLQQQLEEHQAHLQILKAAASGTAFQAV